MRPAAERVVSFVAQLLAFAAERLAPFNRPRLVHFVDRLLRNALGKVLKRELGH